MHRSTTARALIVCTMVLGLSAMAAPAHAGHESDDTEDGYSEEYGSDERAGHGSHLEIEVECDSVEATSHHRISTVTVYFADGTEEEIEVDAREYSDTFTEEIDHAVAESHKQWVVDEADDCDAEPEPSPSPTDDEAAGDDETDDVDDDEGATTDGSEDGSSGTGDGDASTATRDDADRDGTDGDRTASGEATTTLTTSTDDTSRAATATGATPAGAAVATTAPSSPALGSGLIVGGNAEVFGMIFHQGIKTCPSGPFKGMPYINIKDCGDSVLGTRLALTGSGTGIFTAVGLGLMALGALLLRLRRARI